MPSLISTGAPTYGAKHPSATPRNRSLRSNWKATCERRDLVNSIVAKAHQFSERGQYNEELAQWEMLRKFHPRYPGLEFELEHCRKKRDLQVRNEEKAHIVAGDREPMEARNFALALLRKADLRWANFPETRNS